MSKIQMMALPGTHVATVGVKGLMNVVLVVVCSEAGAVMCELCDRLFYERMDYKHHFKRCHLGQFNIRCDACCKGFWKTNTLRQHICYPEMRDENIRLQHEQEEEALRRRSQIRASLGLDDGAGIEVVNVTETQSTEGDAEQLISKSGIVEESASLKRHNNFVVSQLDLKLEASHASSTNVPDVNSVLLQATKNSHSDTSSGTEASALPSRSYSTGKKSISFCKLLQSSLA